MVRLGGTLESDSKVRSGTSPVAGNIAIYLRIFGFVLLIFGSYNKNISLSIDCGFYLAGRDPVHPKPDRH